MYGNNTPVMATPEKVQEHVLTAFEMANHLLNGGFSLEQQNDMIKVIHQKVLNAREERLCVLQKEMDHTKAMMSDLN